MTLHELTVEELRNHYYDLCLIFRGKAKQIDQSTNTSQFFSSMSKLLTTRLYSLNALKFNTTIPLLLLLSPVSSLMCWPLSFSLLNAYIYLPAPKAWHTHNLSTYPHTIQLLPLSPRQHLMEQFHNTITIILWYLKSINV